MNDITILEYKATDTVPGGVERIFTKKPENRGLVQEYSVFHDDKIIGIFALEMRFGGEYEIIKLITTEEKFVGDIFSFIEQKSDRENVVFYIDRDNVNMKTDFLYITKYTYTFFFNRIMYNPFAFSENIRMDIRKYIPYVDKEILDSLIEQNKQLTVDDRQYIIDMYEAEKTRLYGELLSGSITPADVPIYARTHGVYIHGIRYIHGVMNKDRVRGKILIDDLMLDLAKNPFFRNIVKIEEEYKEFERRQLCRDNAKNEKQKDY